MNIALGMIPHSLRLLGLFLTMFWTPFTAWSADGGLTVGHATAEIELGNSSDPQKEAFEAAIRAGFLQVVHRFAPRYRWSDLDTKIARIAPAPLVKNLYPRTVEWRPKTLFVDLAIQFHPQKLAEALGSIGYLVFPPFPHLNMALLIQEPFRSLTPDPLHPVEPSPPTKPLPAMLSDLSKEHGWPTTTIPLAFSDFSIEPPTPEWLEALLVPRIRTGELGWVVVGTTVESRNGPLFTGWSGWIDQDGQGEVHSLDQLVGEGGVEALVQEQFNELLDRWLELKGSQGQVRYSRLLLVRGFDDISTVYRMTAQLRRLPQVDDCRFLRYDDEGLTLTIDAHGPAIDLPRALERLGFGRPEDQTDRLAINHLRSSPVIEER